MKKIVIQGGAKLHGSINISGSKNASLPILAATLLIDKKIILSNVPIVKDILTMVSLLETLGKKVKVKRNSLEITSKNKKNYVAKYELVKTMRAGILVIGPLLAKYDKAKVSLPGGCAIGARPVDIHLDFLSKCGYQNKISKGYVISNKQSIKKKISYKFKKISVGATETAILNCCLSNKEVKLKNIAIEPEIIDLINFLNKSGANIKFIAKRSLLIKGVKSLNGAKYNIMPDRIEAGTYMIASGITQSSLTLNNILIDHLKNIITVLKKIGFKFKFISNTSLKILPSKLKPIKIKTVPYPGFPTDMQAQLMSLLILTKGTSEIKEDIFENRFLHVLELQRMGANIQINNNVAKITGIDKLSGAEVMATDLRASVCLVLAGLVARGKTVINRVYHLERGYEDLVKKLKKCGAKIKFLNA
ncbi:UDP-N-acetylglucosamine 1-carboxyvinyltransferase [Candidatus Pelagibacter sp. HIMB109]|uniref:UDP-N-acetylglucosamine 1-carboxyvinyltransferase n=1 Tax=Candidatus Pelagibacter sp. HIMB109 TaxID=3415412 RepID=UPI003F868484